VGPDPPVKVERGSLLQWELTPPSRDERRTLWSEYLQGSPLAEQLAREHIHSAGRIAELAHVAQREAQLHQREHPDLSDIRRAAWEAEAGLLGSLAQPIPAGIPDEALVLSKSVHEELQQLVARCRAREDLDAGLGITIRARYQQGVRCLLVGPSGTGKTLVAGWLATRLGLPLYRVDLASVVSKYIGETEKNLATLLSRAEHSEIVLLFDEADSLFGKRTDIKDSNDRFANSQTNYLLQRIEFYRGIVLLTSNSRERFDSAFTRRLDIIIELPLPSPPERRALWQSHLGSGHQLTPKQINRLAVGCDLAGGHIRNAVLAAAVAAREGGRSIGIQDAVAGLQGEYRKLGRQFPAELRCYETTSVGRE
jgi:SpoVK/Ycf46/Vps4 family AAA+-type ATPase